MTALSELLRAGLLLGECPQHEPRLLRRTVAAIEGAEAARAAFNDVAAVQLQAAQAAGEGTVAALRSRVLREACRAFLSPPHPPGRAPVVGRALMVAVAELRRRAALNALIDAYLDGFEAEDADVARMGAQLDELAAGWRWRDGDAWPSRIAEFRLFDAAAAPSRLADRVLTSPESVRHTLGSAGLASDLRRTGGLAAAAFSVACARAAELRGSTAVPVQERTIEWARAAETPLAYPGEWPAYANALFLPWRNDEPPSSHRNLLIDAATSYAGDPRIKQARWRPVREAGTAYDVIVRWLTKASVEQFFEIVSETMRERPDMWRERRAFWTRYLKNDLIDAAWVAFCSDGARRAELAALRTGDASLGMFGRCATSASRGPEHAALIMQIGKLTVVDWSHNGSWNVWPEGSPGAPKLFVHNTRRAMDYSPRDLMNAPLHGSHDASGHWRYKLEELIWRHTGRRP